ncbi:MAG: hypothetical protein AABW73_00890 [Nanoarchaeota archaeon]
MCCNIRAGMFGGALRIEIERRSRGHSIDCTTDSESHNHKSSEVSMIENDEASRKYSRTSSMFDSYSEASRSDNAGESQTVSYDLSSKTIGTGSYSAKSLSVGYNLANSGTGAVYDNTVGKYGSNQPGEYESAVGKYE